MVSVSHIIIVMFSSSQSTKLSNEQFSFFCLNYVIENKKNLDDEASTWSSWKGVMFVNDL